MKQIKVKNLDTGEEMDLVEAEDQLPQSINPLSLHIMRLTSEYVSGDRSTMNRNDSDTESMVSSVSNYTLGKMRIFPISISRGKKSCFFFLLRWRKKEEISDEKVPRINGKKNVRLRQIHFNFR